MDEQSRLRALEQYHVLDTLPEKVFDDIVELASAICNTPISLITLLDTDRQWFKAKTGLNAEQTPRAHSFCNHAIQQPEEVMEVHDSFKDDRFKNNPLATGDPHVRFYAGAPLVTPDGHALGALCVIDNKPRELSDEQRRLLGILAKKVISELASDQRSLNHASRHSTTNSRNTEGDDWLPACCSRACGTSATSQPWQRTCVQ